MRITFLGTGTSHGIPVIGCTCSVCRSRDPRDRRSRTSVLVEVQDRRLLIDASPEFRLQALENQLTHLDALLVTHGHADHIGGLDDLRVFTERSSEPLPVFGPASGLDAIRERFGYVFRRTQEGGGKPKLALHRVQAAFHFKGVRITPVPLTHGRLRVFGYRIGTFAYLTDVSRIPEASYRHLRGLNVLVLDALRPKPHSTHFHLEQAVAEARRIKAGVTYFTHMCHLLGHSATERRLPENIHLAYDGLTLEW